MKVKNVFSNVKTTLFCLTANALIMSSILPVSDIYAQDAANSFPMYRYNLQRTGRVPFASPFNENLKWSISSSGEIWSSPVVDSDGVIYVGSRDGNLLSITPKGKVLWAFKTPNEIFGAPAIGTDGIVCFGSADGRIYALNPDGKLKWKFKTGGGFHSSPDFGDKGTVYISSFRS